jgi:hypothetical protein
VVVLKRWDFLAFVAIVVLAVSAGELLGQGANGEVRKSPAEWARDIAHTVSTFAPKGVVEPLGLRFESAASYGNVVEIRYSMADQTGFGRMKAQFESFKSGKISYFCGEGRVVPIRQGVVIREITALRDGSDKIEVVVDKATCDSLILPALADATTLTEMARSIAKAENELEKSGSNALFRFDGTTSHDGIVEKQLTLIDPSAFRSDRVNVDGMITGYNCGKYREQIFQGLVIRYFFVSSDGSPVGNLMIDRSKC